MKYQKKPVVIETYCPNQHNEVSTHQHALEWTHQGKHDVWILSAAEEMRD